MRTQYQFNKNTRKRQNEKPNKEESDELEVKSLQKYEKIIQKQKLMLNVLNVNNEIGFSLIKVKVLRTVNCLLINKNIK